MVFKGHYSLNLGWSGVVRPNRTRFFRLNPFLGWRNRLSWVELSPQGPNSGWNGGGLKFFIRTYFRVELFFFCTKWKKKSSQRKKIHTFIPRVIEILRSQGNVLNHAGFLIQTLYNTFEGFVATQLIFFLVWLCIVFQLEYHAL